MRVILDECLPKRLRRELAGHIVATVQGAGLAGIANGRLLARIQDAYDVLITMDGALPAQQAIAQFRIGVIVLHARSNRIADLKPLAPAILQAMATIGPGQLVHVGAHGAGAP